MFLLAGSAQAQDGAPDALHWAYAAFFGTGRYSIDGAASVYTVRFRPRWNLRESALSEDGSRTAGIELKLPITIGVHDFRQESLLQNTDSGNVSVVTAVPGVEIEIPMRRRWALKPLVYAGYGAQPNSSDSAWIYWAGVKSKLDFTAGRTDWSLLNFLHYAGYSEDSGRRGEFLALTTGFEFTRQLRNKKIGDEPVVLHWHIAHRDHLNELNFDLTGSSQRLDVPSEWELGVAFSRQDSRLSLWRLRWDRVGVAVRFSSDGTLSGFNLTFRSLFDR